MITRMVKDIMKGALENLSKREGVKPNQIMVMIHTKSDDFLPMYFYLVNGVPKTDENGAVLGLNFKKDILNAKIDLMNKEGITATFLSGYFKNAPTNFEIEPKEMYVMITSKDEQNSELNLGVYKGSEFKKRITVEQLFGEDEEQIM